MLQGSVTQWVGDKAKKEDVNLKKELLPKTALLGLQASTIIVQSNQLLANIGDVLAKYWLGRCIGQVISVPNF